ncbi:MAG: hypothetical protein NTV92_09315, partial [Candidatus Bipolaricaulota bacterium]|nr:hypothetical protein [Candidatus Bipolaricaulota bacterium]
SRGRPRALRSYALRCATPWERSTKTPREEALRGNLQFEEVRLMTGSFWTSNRYALRPVAHCCGGARKEPLPRA